MKAAIWMVFPRPTPSIRRTGFPEKAFSTILTTPTSWCQRSPSGSPLEGIRNHAAPSSVQGSRRLSESCFGLKKGMERSGIPRMSQSSSGVRLLYSSTPSVQSISGRSRSRSNAEGSPGSPGSPRQVFKMANSSVREWARRSTWRCVAKKASAQRRGLGTPAAVEIEGGREEEKEGKVAHTALHCAAALRSPSPSPPASLRVERSGL